MRRGRTVVTGATSFIPFNIEGTAATLDVDFTTGGYLGITDATAFTVTRTGPSSTGLYTDATNSSYTSFPANTIRIASGLGCLVEETRTQYLGVTDAPATQTTSSLGTGTYTLWVIGSGTATPSAGTATITGASATSAGTPTQFTVTVAGTVVITVSGSLTRFQLENGGFATSYIPNPAAAGTTAVRGAETVSLTSTNFTSWYGSPTGITFAVECYPLVPIGVAAGNQYLAAISDASLNNRLSIFRQNADGQISYRVVSAASATSPGNNNAVSAGTRFRSVLVSNVAANGAIAATAGNLGTAATPAAMPVSPTKLSLGNNEVGGSSQANNWIRRVTFIPARISNAAAQTMSLV